MQNKTEREGPSISAPSTWKVASKCIPEKVYAVSNGSKVKSPVTTEKQCKKPIAKSLNTSVETINRNLLLKKTNQNGFFSPRYGSTQDTFTE